MYLHTNTPPQLLVCNNGNCTNRMKEQTYKEQKLTKDCYRCALKVTNIDPYIIPQWYKKENGRLKEEIFVNKTVSMKVEQGITRCPQVVDYHP